MAKAYLCNKNRPVLTVEIEGGNIVAKGEVIDYDHLPICLQYNLTLESLNKWMKSRLIPEKREGLKMARQRFPGFENYGNMFSLSDQYWFQFHQRKESWEKLNFFTNPYPSLHGDIFFYPWKVDPDSVATIQSPDLATNGVLAKRWIQDPDTLVSYLLKAGSKTFRQEPLGEVMASITLRRLNLVPSISYELVVHGMRMCSKCKNFVTADTEFVPAAQIYGVREREALKESVYKHLIDMCNEFGIVGAEDYITRMIAADHILGNTDRHLGNFGFIRSAETGEILGFAPLFDSGTAYWASAKTQKSKESRLFFEEEARCFRMAIKKINARLVTDTEALKKMTYTYPGLTQKQRDGIIMRMEELSVEVLEGAERYNRQKEKNEAIAR